MGSEFEGRPPALWFHLNPPPLFDSPLSTWRHPNTFLKEGRNYFRKEFWTKKPTHSPPTAIPLFPFARKEISWPATKIFGSERLPLFFLFRTGGRWNADVVSMFFFPKLSLAWHPVFSPHVRFGRQPPPFRALHTFSQPPSPPTLLPFFVPTTR